MGRARTTTSSPVTAEVNMSIDVEVTGLAYGGDAVGRYEGRVLFVPGGIRGERVRVEIVEERRGHARADLLEILRPAPERVEPQYPLLRDCGCQWQHISYPAQLTWKAHIVRQLLVRIGKQPDALVHPTIGMPSDISPWEYRNIALFSVGPEGEIGFKLTDSHEVQDLESCELLHPALNMVYQRVRSKLQNYFGESLAEMIQGFTIRGAIGAVSTPGAVPVKAAPTLLSIHARPGSDMENPQQLAHELITTAPGIVGVIIERVGGRYGRNNARRRRDCWGDYRTCWWSLWPRGGWPGIPDRRCVRATFPRLLGFVLPGEHGADPCAGGTSCCYARTPALGHRAGWL